MFDNMSIVRKGWLLMGLLALGLGSIVVVTSLSAGAIDRTNREVSERVLPFREGALKLQLHVVQIQQWLTDISATRGLDGLNDGFDVAETEYQAALQGLDSLAGLEAAHADVYADLRRGLEAYYATGTRMAQAYVDGGPQAGNRMMSDFDAAAASLHERLDVLLDRSDEEKAAMLQAQVAASRDASRNVLVLAGGLGVLMLGGLYLLLRALRPLGGLTAAALRIADNDLTGQVPRIAARNEVGGLATAIAAMQDRLVQRVQEIAEVSAQVHRAVETMSAVADHTRMGVEQQRSETEQVATAMNEMTATVHEVARNTAAAANAASEADSEVGNGSRVVRETINSIERLAGEVRKGAEVIIRLEDHSNNIGAVLDVIKGIAEQTNLLALNAAIEAARAGEQGRGFAVVADEVRTLAQRTQKSTQEIQQMIEKLQQGAREAVQVMEHGRSQAETSVAQAAQAGRSLDSIRSAVSTIHDMSTQIASAAEEQSSVAEEINRNIVNIGQIVEQSAGGAAQTATAGEELGELAERLQLVVRRFRLR
jgi:methyl-accepting chemotaxis protein